MKDIVDKAEDILSEDTEGERNSDPGGSPKRSEGTDTLGTEVRKEALIASSCNSVICLRVPLPRIHHPDSWLSTDSEDDFACMLPTRDAKNTIFADVKYVSNWIYFWSSSLWLLEETLHMSIKWMHLHQLFKVILLVLLGLKASAPSTPQPVYQQNGKTLIHRNSYSFSPCTFFSSSEWFPVHL